MRKLVALVLVAVAVATGVALFSVRSQVRRAIATLIEERAADGRAEVSIGGLRLVLWPRPAVAVTDVRMVKAGSRQTLFAAPAIHLYPTWLGLLIGRPHVDRVEMLGPEMVVTREERDGRARLLLPIGTTGLPGMPPFSLSVVQAKLRFEDAIYDPPTVLEVEQLAFGVTPPDEKGWMQLRAMAPALGAESKVDVSGRFRPEPTGDAVVDVDVRFTATRVDREILNLFSPRLADAPFIGSLSFEGSAVGPLGTRTTEIEPAEPLKGQAKARIDMKIGERTAPLDAEFELLLDDRRLQVKDGTFRWNGLAASASGWWETARAGKLGARVELDKMDLAAALGAAGVSEARRPAGAVSAVIKVSGPRTDPRIHYDASWERIELVSAGIPRIEAVDGKATGSLFALNADISGSFQAQRFRLGSAEIHDFRIGAAYWQDKLSLTQLGFPIWGGELDFSAAYYPSRDSVEGGGLANNLDAAALVATLPAEWKPDLEGRADAIFHFGYDARGPWVLGRVGLHRGRIGPRPLGRDLISAIGASQGNMGLVSPELAKSYPELLDEKGVGFRRLAFDFERREDAVVVRALKIDLGDGEVRAEGVLDDQRKVAGWGTLELSGKGSAELAARLPALTTLIPTDGRLRVPFKLATSDGGLEATVDERFLESLTRAGLGESVGPFVPVDPESGIVMDLPSLEEQFFR